MNRNWIRVPVPKEVQGGTTWNKQITSIWKKEDRKEAILCQVRDFINDDTQAMRHFIIKKIDKAKVKQNPLSMKQSEDPTYNDRADILVKLGKWKEIALEVFPREEDLVDQANLYHLWEVENEFLLPFSTDLIGKNYSTYQDQLTSIPNRDKSTFDVTYSVLTRRYAAGIFSFLFIIPNDSNELNWRQKYDIKCAVLGKDISAVEVISSRFSDLGYTCIIGYPDNLRLPFSI